MARYILSACYNFTFFCTSCQRTVEEHHAGSTRSRYWHRGHGAQVCPDDRRGKGGRIAPDRRGLPPVSYTHLAELRTVIELGADLWQGYFLARPAIVPGAIAPEAAGIIQELQRRKKD